jgi:hypothetical protein
MNPSYAYLCVETQINILLKVRHICLLLFIWLELDYGSICSWAGWRTMLVIPELEREVQLLSEISDFRKWFYVLYIMICFSLWLLVPLFAGSLYLQVKSFEWVVFGSVHLQVKLFFIRKWRTNFEVLNQVIVCLFSI